MSIAYAGERGTRTTVVGTGLTEVITLSSSCTLGNTLVLVVTCRDTSLLGCSVADSRGNTWTIDVGPFNTGNNFVMVCSTRQDVARLVTSDTITVTWGTVPNDARMILAEEFSGLLIASYVDVVANNGAAVSSSSCASGTTAPTAQADELAVIAYCLGSPGIGSPTVVTGDASYSSFTTSMLDGSAAGAPKQLYSQYKILSATGAQSGTVTVAPNVTSYQGVIVTYKAAAAAAASGTPPRRDKSLGALLQL